MAAAAQEKPPVWDANKVVLVSVPIGKNVHALHAPAIKDYGVAAATCGGIIVGEKGVMIVETMLNKRLNLQVQEHVKKLANKPILYAVNTSSHGDHWYGNMYLPQETKIIMHENAKTYIEKHLADDKAFMIANFGKGRGIEDIVARTGDILVPLKGKIKVDLGAGKIVEIIDFGFAQTGGDLFIWEPEAKVLWTGNALLQEPAYPWLLDGHLIEAYDTLKAVYDFLPQDAKVVPGHGSPCDREALKYSLTYLELLKKHVQAAVDKKLSPEDTLKTVSEEMKQYRSYPLFDWVHCMVNVPKAHEELKQSKK